MVMDSADHLERRAKRVTGELKKQLLKEAAAIRAREKSRLELAAHNARVARSEEVTKTRRVRGQRRVIDKPFDPEEGRYRTARPLPDATSRLKPGFEGYPRDARLDCPSCGLAPAAYLKYGRYICAVDRLSRKGVGCGHQWSGPMNASEARRIQERRAMGYGTEPPPAIITESMYPGTGYPAPPKGRE